MVGIVVGGVIVTVGAALISTTTDGAVVAVPLLLVPEPRTPAVAETVVFTAVVSVVCASPDALLVATALEREPAVVVKVTGTPIRALPLASSTVAVMTELPPLDGTVAGLALSDTIETAAPPILIDRLVGEPVVVPPVDPVVPVPVPVLVEPAGRDTLAAPDDAVMFATPDCVPATKVTVAVPFSVCACAEG